MKYENPKSANINAVPKLINMAIVDFGYFFKAFQCMDIVDL
jgi:hypothetical protein